MNYIINLLFFDMISSTFQSKNQRVLWEKNQRGSLEKKEKNEKRAVPSNLGNIRT